MASSRLAVVTGVIVTAIVLALICNVGAQRRGGVPAGWTLLRLTAGETGLGLTMPMR